MKGPLAGTYVHTFMTSIGSDRAQPAPLQPFLQMPDVDIFHGAGDKVWIIGRGFHQHRFAKHFIEREGILHDFVVTQSYQNVVKIRERFVSILETKVDPVRSPRDYYPAAA